MPDVVIRTDGLGKMYTIGHEGDRAHYASLRDVLARGVRNAIRKGLDMAHGRAIVEGDVLEDVWALRHVSFEVRQGEVIGVIGRNGAGKSTLLKILSRITEPTEGRATIRGRVASLLEVGTGFHPELSGRENIFLNGAILGMTRDEIRTKFDDIVAFAEVEKYIDTPVKRYSSGMYVRLAFAVAAHLDPEILLVDEVLAVGDAMFQKKCLSKMNEVAKGGRTVFFISHNMASVTELTSRALLIDHGQIRMDGASSEVVAAYLTRSGGSGGSYRRKATADRPCVMGVDVVTSEGGGLHAFGLPLRVRIALSTPSPLWGATVSFQICDETSRPITHVWVQDSDMPFCRSAGEETLECEMPDPRLFMGRYSLTVYFSERPGGEFFERLEGVCSFDVSMHNQTREYPWQPGDCVYLEKAHWSRL
jgi:lipopolysaccharide transport system ATP-binding protein